MFQSGKQADVVNDKASGASRPRGTGPASQPLQRLQRTVGNAAVVQMLQRAGHLPAGRRLQLLVDDGRQDEQPQVQRSTVHDVLRSPGRPLDTATRDDMESRFGADFSDVRIHDDHRARNSAAEVGARAYTSGSHVVIGEGGGDHHTLAHELTHVIQQRQGPVAGTDNGTGLRVSDPSDRFEREAEANATRLMSTGARHAADAADTARPGRAVRKDAPPSSATTVQGAWEMRDGTYQFVEDDDSVFQASLHEATGDTKKLRRELAEKWLEAAGLGENDKRSAYYRSTAYRSLDTFLKSGPEREYGPNDQARFMNELAAYSAGKDADKQDELLTSVVELGDWIEKTYPPGTFVYVGLGRSPAAVMAHLQSRNPRITHSIPLSSFRPGPEDPGSILGKVLTTKSRERNWFGRKSAVSRPSAPPSEQQQAMLDAHFAEFLPKDLPGKVLLIDYTQSAQSLVSAQHYLQRYLGKKTPVYGLALHEDRHQAQVRAVYEAVTVDEEVPMPYSPTDLDVIEDLADERATWGERFASRNVGDDTPLAEAFRRELFDEYSQYGSYTLLEQELQSFEAGRPRTSDEREAYQVLKEEIEKLDKSRGARS
ncbi:DUF4157 domain-containing protein [Streptomyces sp. SP17BM10]|uniref:eCIS core domain-containing protein n=1 Tax=Streptomyces sp. SP17BM10 TaxID=3002530 RepID=UPI002E7A29B0|nr:DUF4157 domain-containing protein [Streptomyces sp. SP17BM10]MEE1783794.1 DUF4157 domain-containing protein [Streptomyces sp. SP17BM10]